MTTDPALAPLVDRTRGLQPWRRLFHAASGVTIAGTLATMDPPWLVAVGVLGILTLGAVALDVVRLRVPSVNRAFFRMLRPLASPREARGLASSTWYLLGALTTVALFPRELAVAAILVLALADPAASVLGRRWGRRRLGAGTVEGSLVFLAVAVAILVPMAGWPAGVLTAVAVAVAEVLPWPLDDNLVIPAATGALLWTLLPVL